jgi:hypothetical protein
MFRQNTRTCSSTVKHGACCSRSKQHLLQEHARLLAPRLFTAHGRACATRKKKEKLQGACTRWCKPRREFQETKRNVVEILVELITLHGFSDRDRQVCMADLPCSCSQCALETQQSALFVVCILKKLRRSRTPPFDMLGSSQSTLYSVSCDCRQLQTVRVG